jgi:hypothetical protein
MAKSTASQLQSQLWIWRWEVIRNASFMFKQVSFDISNINIEEFEVRSRLSKNGKIFDQLQLKITSSIKLQMKFCPT